jgi:hypothetical protein
LPLNRKKWKRSVIRKMKLISLALLVLPQLFGGANSSSVTDECEVICKEIRSGILGETHSSCEPALNINPSPTVYKSCQLGKKKAFDKACVPLCSDKKIRLSLFDASDSCKLGRGPSEHWCRRGFSSTLKKLQAYSFPVSEKVIGEEVVPRADRADTEVYEESPTHVDEFDDFSFSAPTEEDLPAEVDTALTEEEEEAPMETAVEENNDFGDFTTPAEMDAALIEMDTALAENPEPSSVDLAQEQKEVDDDLRKDANASLHKEPESDEEPAW